MIVYAVYVISEDGRTLLSENFQSKEVPDAVLLGGLFTALQQMASAMTSQEQELESVIIEGLSYHIRSFGMIRIVLVTDVPRSPEETIQTLGLRFMKEYGEILVDWDSNLNIFNPFRNVIREIIGEDKSGIILNPIKKLNTGEIFNLPHLLQPTALALLSIGEGTVQEITEEINRNAPLDSLEVRKTLRKLQELGYIGIKYLEGNNIYFCTI